MKTDLYTKIVLTVIAGALIAIFFRLSDSNLVTTAQAATIPAPAPQAVQHEVIDVNIVQVGGGELGWYLPVEIKK
ncbi:hypothetical protein [Dysgonomonas massiliensis]|uniref:hypothetical protein n=1 Tax=Dysgonomonas massiliensis TaxID=2040292 RepID=UPI000C75811B|nr:hypothetical protein [Dysgonomonas massiliensis]